jgi:hypothetical protein
LQFEFRVDLIEPDRQPLGLAKAFLRNLVCSFDYPPVSAEVISVCSHRQRRLPVRPTLFTAARTSARGTFQINQSSITGKLA